MDELDWIAYEVSLITDDEIELRLSLALLPSLDSNQEPRCSRGRRSAN
jgi:hypothetical protein